LQLPKPTAQVSEHVEAEQVGVALVVEQADPQAPQFVALVARFVSQPSVPTPLQLPYPAVHVPSVHVPDAQLSPAFGRSQITPQPPQSVSVRMLFSQPLFGLPSQLAYPDAQVGVHTPEEHTVVPLALEQATPHALQLAALVFRLASQPSEATPLQLPKPVLHVPSTQAPPLQLAPALANVQEVPQAPQLVTVVFRFVSQPLVRSPSQSPQPALQVGAHFPAVHATPPCGFVQAIPQVPQFAAVVFRFVSQPLDGSLSQFPKPAVHVPSVHTPPGQVSVAFARLHTAPQPPQLLRVVVLVSQPFAGFPSQLAKPAAHTGRHVPAGQLVVPFAFVQAAPHAPQFVVVLSDASHPFETWVSQLPKPVLHTMLQAPSEQLAVPFAELHAWPHAPQSATVELVFVSQPFVGSESQLPHGAVQVPRVHTPETHDSDAFARLHTAPQPPQLARLVFRFVSQPSAELPLQSPRPALQLEMPQTPATQFAVPPVDGQTLPQVEQFDTLVCVFTSQPLDATPSQSW
jgi:hypothetical protein